LSDIASPSTGISIIYALFIPQLPRNPAFAKSFARLPRKVDGQLRRLTHLGLTITIQ